MYMGTYKEYLIKHEACVDAMAFAASKFFDFELCINEARNHWLIWQAIKLNLYTLHDLSKLSVSMVELMSKFSPHSVIYNALNFANEYIEHPNHETKQDIRSLYTSLWSKSAPFENKVAISLLLSCLSLNGCTATSFYVYQKCVALNNAELNSRIETLLSPIRTNLLTQAHLFIV